MSGSLEVIVGSMFSGKSEELIRRAKRSVIARRPVQVFKPAVDDRFGAEIVRSHDGGSFVAIPVRTSADLRSRIGPDTAVVAIDEVQFFDAGIVDVCRRLVQDGRRVVCAGLDLDFRGEPFGLRQAIARVCLPRITTPSMTACPPYACLGAGISAPAPSAAPRDGCGSAPRMPPGLR